MSDWRELLLRRFSFPAYERLGRNPLGWPDYSPREVVTYAIGEIGSQKVVAAVWDFAAYGGSFGELDATAFADAADTAARYGEPLVSLVRSGGIRLQEGMAGLVGMPRAQLALRRLSDAGVPHIAVADEPTTGGVFVSIVSRADFRVGVVGATVGFAGPRVAEAVTGEALSSESHTAESAYAAGLLDALVPGDDVAATLGHVLRALSDGESALPVAAGDGSAALSDRAGDAQVRHARRVDRIAGRTLLSTLFPDGVGVRCVGDDGTVVAVAGRYLGDGPSVVGVALAAEPGGRPTAAGYRTVVRAAALADRLDRPLVVLIDTPSAEPGELAESAGIAAGIADAMDAVLSCRAPTLAVVTGEGGSGGALAGAVTDRVLVTPSGYFAALGPEGAAVALRSTPDATAARLRLRPPDLLRLGFADGVVPDAEDSAFAQGVASHLGALRSQAADDRLAARRQRWSSPLPGSLT